MTTVFIWNNNMVTFGHSYCGHASMMIDDAWRGSNDMNYVSFWPDDGAKAMSLPGRSALERHVGADVESENYVPDHCLRLTGLQVDAMLAEWSNAMRNASYQMLRDNCSSAVARVLRAGSPAGSALQRHSVLWTPLKVKRLALALGAKPLPWTQIMDELEAAGTIGGREARLMRLEPKRDARHGTSTTSARFDKGHQMMAKPNISWPDQAPRRPQGIRMSAGAMLNGHTDINAMVDAAQRMIDEA